MAIIYETLWIKKLSLERNLNLIVNLSLSALILKFWNSPKATKLIAHELFCNELIIHFLQKLKY